MSCTAECGAEVGRFLHQREVFGRQALQREAALAALEHQLALARFEADRLVGRHAAQDVDQLARAHGGGEGAFVTAELGGGADLDLQVAGGQLDLAAGLADQHVGQDRQRVAALDDAGHRLQRGEDFVLSCLQDDHVSLPLLFLVVSSGIGWSRRVSP
jgi:hypothetical protein